MKPAWLPAGLLVCALLGPSPAGRCAPENPVKHASNFSSLEYFDPPNQMQISSHLTGQEASPLPNGRLVIKQFKLETYSTNGTLELIVEAPECIYDQFKVTANSAGYIKVRQADGQVQLEGVGFLWLQDDKFLTLSNQVNTTIAATNEFKL